MENEEELLDVYFAVPAADSVNSKFLTTAEISEKLISAGNIKRPMPLSRLGMDSDSMDLLPVGKER